MKLPGKKTVLSFVLPVRAVTGAFSSVKKTGEALGDTFKKMGEQLPGPAVAGTYPEGDVRNISDAKQRFEAMYEMHEWNEKDLAKQVKTTKNTKLTAMVTGILALAGVIALAVKAPLWLSVFLIPVSAAVIVLGLAQSFKYALYEAQLDLREFISAREFVARADLWARYFG
jgi:hypothetical protein